jgi:peptidoglycan/LPS O-acetylase OafA/YrhL
MQRFPRTKFPTNLCAVPQTLPQPTLPTQARGTERFPSRVTKTSSGRVFGLDVLRAGAILSVLVAHDFNVLWPYLPWWVGFCGHGGYYGVELFFVLSGFLIGTILIRTDAELRQPSRVITFYLRRWFRTLPLFFLFVLLNLWLELSVRHHLPPWSEIWRHALFLRNLTGLHMTFFGESWSLAIEEWFYLLFPIVLFVGLRLTRNFNRVLLAAALAFFLFSNIGRMVIASASYATWTEWERKTVLLRFDGLMLGVFAAWIALRYPKIWSNRVWIPTVLGLALVAVIYTSLFTVSDYDLAWGPDTYFARTTRFTLVSLGFALLLPAASSWKLDRENFLSGLVRRIALWSYALYLVHIPIITVVQHYFTTAKSFGHGVALFVLAFGGSIAISALLYRYFESRCTHLRDAVAPAVGRAIANRVG